MQLPSDPIDAAGESTDHGSHHHDGDGHHDHAHHAHTHGQRSHDDRADDDHTHSGARHFLQNLWSPHSHDAKDSIDQALESSGDGIRAVAVSLVILLLTAGVQALVVALSGSVALLGDTLHNAADAFTAVPLWLAFKLGRRPATRRFTYGFGKSEDIAGVMILGLIAISAVFAGYEAIARFLHPRVVTHLGYVMAAAVIGAIGNEVVAQYRMRVGRRIGSASLEADGLHARADGITSLLVLVGAIGVEFGLRWADPVVGLLITAALLVVGYRSARSTGQRLLDAVDPSVIDRITATVAVVPGVVGVSEVQARWVGHRLLAQLRIVVDRELSVSAAHEIGEAAHHELLHHVSNLSSAVIHVDPDTPEVDPHTSTAHHRGGAR